MYTIRKRMKRIAYWILICLVILIARLAQIQLVETKSFTNKNINLLEESVKQRTQQVIIDSGRGKFYDRNMKPLTHETIPSLVLFPFLQHMEWDVEKVADILHIESHKIIEAINNAKEPIVFGEPNPLELTESQFQAINELQIPGVFAIHKQFTRKNGLASQLIGIVGENAEELQRRYPQKQFSSNTLTGVTGLQKRFDEFLIQEETSKLVYHVDGRGGPLFGIDVKYVDPSNPYYPVNVQTTIDFSIQNEAEKIVDKHHINKGGLILLDIETNSILASVSRPELNERDPFSNDGAKNFMLSAEIPGSIFKTVIAAAAIDRLETSGRTFDCSKTITGEADTVYNHGVLDFKNSFAVSCNQTFATLAKELATLDNNLIEKYAEKLGLLHKVGWQGDVFHFEQFLQLDNEEVGQVFLQEEDRKDVNFIAQSGIGQHNVRVTPLAAANMMATIARGGKKEMVRAVSSIQYKNGSVLYTFPKKAFEEKSISPYTAMKLQALLREVVVNEKGTGRLLQDLPYEVAGKSGTAETNRYKDSKQYLNKWFIGYFPFQEPKYALAVVNLDVFSEEGSVTPVFQDMVKYLYDYDKNSKHP